jgi:hypothetical protein
MEPITGRGRAALSLALAPVVAAALAAPAAAAPTWLAPFDIAPADRTVRQTAAAFGSSGALAFAWATSSAEGVNAIAQARRPAGAAPGGAPALAAENAADPVLATGPDGTVYAAWTVSDPARFGDAAVNVAQLGADGSIAQRAVLSGADNASTPELAVAADGTLGVGWVASDDEELGQVRAAVGTFGAFTVRTVSAGDNNASDAAVDFDDGGTLHVAWARLDSQEEGRIKVATVTRAGIVSGATIVSAAAVNAGEPTVAAGAFGEAVAWTEIGADESGTVRFALRSGAGFPPGQPALGGGDGSSPRLAEAPAGAVRLAWVSTNAADRGSALVATVDGGVLSPTPATVSGSDDVTQVRLAYAPTGDGVAVWRRELDPEEPDLADVRAAGFDAAGPQLLELAIPDRARVGVPAAFSVRAVDVWSAVSRITWLFGDGEQATGAQVSHTYDAPRSPATVTVRSTDAVGNQTESTGQTAVEPSTPPSTPTPTPTPTATPTAVPAPAPAALRLEDVVAEFACVRYLGASAPGRRAAFAFTLSETATVSVRIQRRMESKPKRKCPAPKPGGKPGTYTDAVTVTAPAGVGRGRVETGPEGETMTAGAARHGMLRRKLRRGRAAISLKQLTGDSPLAPGTYVARISAQTADGRRSAETTIKFWVLNRRS